MPSPGLDAHPDRLRWNARYGEGFTASYRPHPLASRALAMPLPDGPVADLACGPSGSALLAAAAGRPVTAVDVSDAALRLLAAEAQRRRLDGLITLVQADLRAWRPEPGRYALVLCTGYWDRAVFGRAVRAVMAGGLLAWEAFTVAARADRPSLPAEWCLAPGEPASLLPDGFEVAGPEPAPEARPDRQPGRGTEPGAGQPARRSLLARRTG